MTDSDAYYQISQKMARRKDVSSTAKVLYGLIRNRIGDHPDCWPGVRSMAADIGVSVPTIIKAVRELAGKGYIVVDTGGRGRTNHYRLTSESAQESLPKCSSSLTSSTQESLPKRSSSLTSSVQESSSKPVKTLARNNTSERTPRKNTKKIDLPAVLDCAEFRTPPKGRRASTGGTRRQEPARRVVQAYIGAVERPGDANTEQACKNVEKLMKAGHTEEQLIACAANYVAGDDFPDNPQYRYKASNFYGLKAYWKAYTAEAVSNMPTPNRIGCDSKPFVAELEAQGVIQPEQETT